MVFKILIRSKPPSFGLVHECVKCVHGIKKIHNS